MIQRVLIVHTLAALGACSESGESCQTGDAPVTVVSTELQAHYVRLDLQYSGGCEDHEFAVWWTDGLVAPSNPPKLQLQLQHYDHGDSCDALVNRSLWVDLSPLHDVMLGTDRFLISFNVGGGTIDYTFAAAAPPPADDVVEIDQSCGPH